MSTTYPQPPVHPHYPPRPQNGNGTTALVLGIVGACLCWVPVLGGILGLLAVVFGGMGLAQHNRGEATNWAASSWGLGLGIFALAFFPLLLLLVA